MPRQVRIEYPGAIYHSMARGDRREPIVVDDEDRDRVRRLLGELVQQTGWEVFAWVLMTNHYHAVFKTPEPNLVMGMKWLQNTWTKRFNARHGLWGHVYGGRYKAVLVEENEHSSCLIDYVHLNPFRAGMVNLDSDAKRQARSGYTGAQAKDHGEAAALRLVTLGVRLTGLENADLDSLRKNDWRKRVIGRAIRRNTTMPAAWISEQLRMGNVVRCAALTARDPDDSWGSQWK